jgi:sulfonate transport system substrate-binding protein
MEAIEEGKGLARRSALRVLGGAGLALASLTQPRPARAAGLIPIRIADTPKRWGGFETVLVADAKGFFRAEGLELELVPLPPDQSTVAIDTGIVNFSPTADYLYFVNVRDKGLKTRQTVSTPPHFDPRRANDGLFVLENSSIQGPADLRGKKIAMTSLSFSSAWYTLDYLARSGLRRDDVTYLAIPALQQEQVLVGGHVDAVFAFSPIDAILRRKGGFRQLFSTADIPGRRILRGATMVKEDYIKKNPDILRRYVAAIAKTIDWANRNQVEVVQIGIKSGRLDPELAPYIYTKDGKGDYGVLSWPEHGLQNAADIKFWLDLAERYDVIPKGNLKLPELYTNEFNPFA